MNYVQRSCVTLCIVLFTVSFVFAQSIPKPEEILGFRVGDDFKLLNYQEALEYFEALDNSYSLIEVREAGKTTLGNSMIYAIISSEENMAQLDHYKDISKQLALVKGLDDEHAKQLANEGKAIVYIDGSLHASEVAHGQMLPQLAYDLVASNDPVTREIRDKTILILVFANPDGMDMVVDWYRSNLGTEYEVSPMPWLYHHYVGHDNNRDSYMNNMAETQNITRLVNHEWFPVVQYNHHQTAPFPTRIFIPLSAEPTNPNLHPMVIRGKNLFGTSIGYALEQEGKVGAISRINFDLWYPGYVDEVGLHFNIIAYMSETALYRYATPHFYTLDDFPEAYRDFTISSFYPSPWKGGWWRLRDAVEYMLTTSKATLQTAARFSDELLYNKFQMGKDIINKFKNEPPYAWIVPQQQWDNPTAALLMNKMIFMGIDVYEASEEFVSDGITYPSGTWIIPMDQPFAYFVKTMFEEQDAPDLAQYPDLWQGTVGPQEFENVYIPHQDQDGWTLPYQMGVNRVAANSPLDIPMDQIENAEPLPGSVNGRAASSYLISPKTNNSFIAANRILENGGAVSRLQETIEVNNIEHLPGTWIVESGSISGSFMNTLADNLSLTITGVGRAITSKTAAVSQPRTALYKSWRASMDEGWTRWILEQYEFPFENIFDADVRAGRLNDRFDVIVLPSMSTDAIVNGHETGTVPPQYVGGIADIGVENLRKFVQNGGTLVALNRSALFAIDEFDAPFMNALEGLDDNDNGEPQFAIPGSLLQMKFNNSHPIAFGMPEEAPVFFNNSPAFLVNDYDEENGSYDIIAEYPDRDLLMSGFQIGEEFLYNAAGAVNYSYEKGTVILLGFGVQTRAQTHGTFKLLFNSLYYATSQ